MSAGKETRIIATIKNQWADISVSHPIIGIYTTFGCGGLRPLGPIPVINFKYFKEVVTNHNLFIRHIRYVGNRLVLGDPRPRDLAAHDFFDLFCTKASIPAYPARN